MKRTKLLIKTSLVKKMVILTRWSIIDRLVGFLKQNLLQKSECLIVIVMAFGFMRIFYFQQKKNNSIKNYTIN